MSAQAANGILLSDAYAGDVSPQEAWDVLADDPQAQIVDVRTQPEWTFSGAPNLGSLNKPTHMISWKLYPTMEVNDQFISRLEATFTDKSVPLYFLCKTGGRSLDAAIAATKAGYKTCYNIENGFEGDRDSDGHRGKLNGWKATNLPWEQA